MCGIIITKNINKIPLIKHRGIESNFVKKDSYYLGHHRLPIQTLEGDNLQQPIELNHGYLLYNGEIFNYPKRFNSDVEYLINLFNGSCGDIHEVLEEANHWDGFWSIVYVTEHMMHCFTDPLGKKQLYYNESGEICSEIRPLVKPEYKFDLFFKSSVYKWGYNTTDHTPWDGVKRIMPNKLYTFCAGLVLNQTHKPYYDWTANQPKEDLKELLYKSVESRLISKKYDIGCLVSGGLDSSIIARILKDLEAPVSYYTIDNDEAKYAQILANYLDIFPRYLSCDIPENLNGAFKWNETPIDLGSVIPQHELFKVIPERIVLSGDGADELFGGYRRIKEYDSQYSDVFEELPFYHLPRLDRASMRFTIELRNPFLSHDIVKYALKLPYSERINKKHLKNVFKDSLPSEIVYRQKWPLKNKSIREDPKKYRELIFNRFYNQIF